MWQLFVSSDPRLQRLHGQVTQHPGWVWQLSLLAAAPFLVVLVFGAVLLLAGALVVGGTVFAVLGWMAQLLGGLGGSGGKPMGKATRQQPASDGRVNVRVLDPNQKR